MNRYQRPLSQTQLREQNLSTILYCLKAEAPVSRAQLAKLTELNKSTVSSLTEELLSIGIIREVGQADSDGGRPATLLEIDADGGLIIGVDIGVHVVSAVLTNLSARIVARFEQPTQTTDQDEVLATTTHLIDRCLNHPLAQDGRVLGIGVGVSGIIDPDAGEIIYTPNLKWRHVSLRHRLAAQFGLPIYVENNANAAALGEYFFGAAQQIDNFIFVSIGKGLGAGLILNGQLFRGVSGLAGEIGQSHVVQGGKWLANVDAEKQVRWHSFANKEALLGLVDGELEHGRASILRQWRDQNNGVVTLKMLKQAAEAGDEVALFALKKVGELLGLGIANLVHFIDPSLVLIGGEFATIGAPLTPHIARIVKASDLIERHEPIQIEVSTFGEDAILIGAVTLVVQAIMNHPKQLLMADYVA